MAGSRALVEWLLNRARSYIYSTAAPAATAAAALAALDIVAAEPQRGGELLARAASLRDELAAQGWDVGRSQSQIIPIVVGAPARAVELSARLAPARPVGAGDPSADRARGPGAFAHQSDRGPHAGDDRDAVGALQTCVGPLSLRERVRVRAFRCPAGATAVSAVLKLGPHVRIEARPPHQANAA